MNFKKIKFIDATFWQNIAYTLHITYFQSNFVDDRI